MKGLKYIKFIQKERENAIRNSWKLKNVTLKDKEKDIYFLSKNLRIPPLLIVRRFMLLEGYTKKEVNQAIEGTLEVNEFYYRLLEKARENDLINSPLANKRAKERGLEGEVILREWLNHLNFEFEIDPANGKDSLPDILLAEPMKIFGQEIKWIESKCSFGSEFDLKRHRKQFDNFDSFGHGCIVFWFGFEPNNDYFMISGNDLKKVLPEFLVDRVDKMLNFVPTEFYKYLNAKRRRFYKKNKRE
ncbi:MAG: hypothetical protein EAX96_13955 [Candidatus Lokiarchaeota archaeon]|nr:hypothetical protein [Candidatus Lokiarchaeota archaeon]